eukprot:TRINITY_DN1555_c0_g1_i1.p1 TRINITY_DN1555_c0_g1~~TRINITY_DN1555_c0_g1_i1.p1  ORF type:complete len:215 (+),score=71.83 TRINITY_DN1555_c0_g1_i1:58-702(+)
MATPEMIQGMMGSQRSTDVDKKLEKANTEKEAGNEFFKTGEFRKAMYHYHQGLLNLKGLVGLTPEEKSRSDASTVTICNNMAAVHLKESKWDKCIKSCNEVLAIQPNNPKALFRRGKSYLSNNDLDKAGVDLEKAHNLDPTDKAIPQLLDILKKKNAVSEKKAAAFFSNMFTAMKNDTEKEPAKEVPKPMTAPFKDEEQQDENDYRPMESDEEK